MYNNKEFCQFYTLRFVDKDPVAEQASALLRKIQDSNFTSDHFLELCDEATYYKYLVRSIDLLSSPINTHSMPSSSQISFEASSKGNKVLYGGEGADEIFLGYGCYRNFAQTSIYNKKIEDNFKNINFDSLNDKYEVEDSIHSYAKEIKSKLSQYINDQDLLNLKTQSFVDTFIQLNNVGLLGSDTINSDHGIECRTPFVRKNLLEFGLSSPVNKLVSNTKMKIPLTNMFIKVFGEEAVMNKMGFAGYPNETLAKLPTFKDWYIWNYLPYEKIVNYKLNQAESWKLINLEWFFRICFN